MKWWIEGVHMDTGEPAKGYVDGASEEEARAAASSERVAVARCVTADRRVAEQRAANQVPPEQATLTSWVTGGKRVAKAVAYAGKSVAESKRTRQVEMVQQGRHVQWVRLCGSSEVSLVITVTMGVFLGLMMFSCCGGFLALALGIGGIAAGGAAAGGP